MYESYEWVMGCESAQLNPNISPKDLRLTRQARESRMGIVTRNIRYRNPVDFTHLLPVEGKFRSRPSWRQVIYQILSYLSARDLKAVRLVNRFLSGVGGQNSLWSEVCRMKWSEKRCLMTIPVPTPFVPDPEEEMEDVYPAEPIKLDKYLLSMENITKHRSDQLRGATLHELACYFPAFHLVDGSWMAAYNLVEKHMRIAYLHATVKGNHFAISNTQWEL